MSLRIKIGRDMPIALEIYNLKILLSITCDSKFLLNLCYREVIYHRRVQI